MKNLLGMMKVVAASAVLMVATAKASNSVDWFSAGGATDFDNSSIFFAGFNANQLTSMTGDGYFHNHDFTGQTITVSLHVDGNWVSVFSYFNPISNDDTPLSSVLNAPISFAGGIVDGINLQSDVFIGNAFHGWYNSSWGGQDDVFTFNSVPDSGASIALLGAGLIGLAGLRRKLRRA